MSRRVQCKFFAHGACLKGESCEFSHDWIAPPNNICTFYQKGMCSYGSRCRYEHAKLSRLHSSVPSTAAEVSFSIVRPSGTAGYDGNSSPATFAEHSAANGSFYPPSRPAWEENLGNQDLPESGEEARYLRSVDPAYQSICSFAAAGDCPRGNKCPHIHGDPCPTCGKCCLHPYRPQEREEHMRTCEKMQNHLEALRHSQEIECSVCLERVLSKPISAERKFGILSECDHPFCISCIRNWRGSSPTSGLDVNSALRACPICRKLSYFVIPSVIWYSSKEEKQEIVDSYKKKLNTLNLGMGPALSGQVVSTRYTIHHTCRSEGAKIARTECGKYGKASCYVFHQKINYAPTEVSTRYGILGVKVWIHIVKKEGGVRYPKRTKYSKYRKGRCSRGCKADGTQLGTNSSCAARTVPYSKVV